MALRQYGRKPFEIFTLDDIFSDVDIASWVAKIDASCYFHAAENSEETVRPFSSISKFHNGKTYDPCTASHIYSAIVPRMPSAKLYESFDGNLWRFEQSIDHIMFAKVSAEQGFGIHTDTGCEFDVDRNRFSKFTVLTYLNSDDFSGGNTEFYDESWRNVIATITPRKNRTLVFDIDLFHKGHVVKSGSKYWLGTELVCSRVS